MNATTTWWRSRIPILVALINVANIGIAQLCFPWYTNFTRICWPRTIAIAGNASHPSTLLGFDLPFDYANFAPCGYALSVQGAEGLQGYMRVSSSKWFEPSATTVYNISAAGEVATPWFGDEGGSKGPCDGAMETPQIVYIDVELTQTQTQQATFVINQTSGVWPNVDRQFSWDGSSQAGLEAVYPVGRLPTGWTTASLTAKASTSNSACYWSVAFGQFVDGNERVYANRTHLCSEEPPLCKPDQEFTANADGKGVVHNATWFVHVTGGEQYLGTGTDCYVSVGVSVKNW
jgi:hypothetical protein